MGHVFQSGAFLQQCFSVHPLSLSVKVFNRPETIGIVCMNCKSRHRLTVETLTLIIGDVESGQEGASTKLEACIRHHQEALHVTEVSVDRDLVQFRCRACKTSFQATVSRFETYQP